MNTANKPSRLLLPLTILGGILALVGTTLVVYRPDRPVAHLVPGSSPATAFVVQVIRPRAGLPLGGLLPPQLFGLEAHLGFDTRSPGASARRAGDGRYEFRADDWQVDLCVDAQGRILPETQVVFELLFQERRQRVRCRVGDPAQGTLRTVELAGGEELSGSFDIELSRCEEAESGKPLGWPAQPLVLHGSFDRLAPAYRQ